jgi:pimeloyl-ACP methyl ester carboxylesterase
MPTLVLLPGMDGTGILFEPFIQSFGDNFKVQVIAYPTDKPLYYNELTAIVEKSLPNGENYFMLGESFSGPIAISIAATKPPGLMGLILCCTFARNPLPKLTKINFLIDWLPFALPPDKILNYLLLGDFSTPKLLASLKSSITKVTKQTLKTRLKAVLTVDECAKLKQLNIPILYLQADHDRLIPKSAGKLIQQINPQTKITTIPAPHLLLQTKPGQAALSIKSFIAENSRVGCIQSGTGIEAPSLTFQPRNNH